MTTAKEIVDLMGDISEVKIVKLESSRDGLTFINRKKIKVPAGKYTDLGPDDKDDSYRLLSDDELNILYLVKLE